MIGSALPNGGRVGKDEIDSLICQFRDLFATIRDERFVRISCTVIRARGKGYHMKRSVPEPSLKLMLAAVTSPARFARHGLGFKVPRE